MLDLIALLPLSMIIPPILLFACQVKRRADPTAVTISAEQSSKAAAQAAQLPHQPLSILDPGHPGDKQSDSKIYDSIAKTDRLAALNPKQNTAEATIDAAQKVESQTAEKADKPEKDKSEGEKTNYNILGLSREEADEGQPGKSKKKTTMTKATMTKDEKNEEKKAAAPVCSTTTCAVKPQACSTTTAGMKPTTPVPALSTTTAVLKPMEQPKSVPCFVDANVVGKSFNCDEKRKTHMNNDKKDAKKEVKAAEEKNDIDARLDQSQIESVLIPHNPPKEEPKPVEHKTADMDEALAVTPPTVHSVRQAHGAAIAEAPQMTQLMSVMEIKKKPKAGINATQVTENSTFFNVHK